MTLFYGIESLTCVGQQQQSASDADYSRRLAATSLSIQSSPTLQPDVVVHNTLSRFRRELKIYLFRRSYPSVLFYFFRGFCSFYLGHIKKFSCDVMFAVAAQSAWNQRPTDISGKKSGNLFEIPQKTFLLSADLS